MLLELRQHLRRRRPQDLVDFGDLVELVCAGEERVK